MLVATEKNETQKKIYFSVAHGKLVKSNRDGSKEYFSAIGGEIESLHQKDRNFNGERVVYWYIDLRDEETRDLYSIGFPYYSNVFKSVILALASADDIQKGSTISLEVYEKDGQTKVKVFKEGVKLDWITADLPPVEVIEIGGRKIKDDSNRMSLISKYAIEVGAKIGSIKGK